MYAPTTALRGRPSMTASESPSRRRTCPRCGARARVVSNPYYGVGLSVHTQLWTCTRCQSVGFVDLGKAPTGSRTGEPAKPPTPRIRGGLARLIGLARR